MKLLTLLPLVLGLAAGSRGQSTNDPYSEWSGSATRNGATVDLGYEQYAGQTENGVATWKGVRYAAQPKRFQAPDVPVKNRSSVIPATGASPCLQLFGTPFGSEDCLFLNIFAPPDAADLPVFVYIHGGGYTSGLALADATDFITGAENRFVGVFLQYRLNAFGWLSSDDVKANGKLNAGLLDMELALKWVQAYIHLFGGDPTRVTLAGESAGAGAVMQLSLLRGGSLGTSLFNQTLAASPYLPKQFHFNDSVPSFYYNNLVSLTGCNSAKRASSAFECLSQLDAGTLASAAGSAVQDPNEVTWGFTPVVDGDLIQKLPSQQLQEKKVNGKAILVGNNANEGATFAPTNVRTEGDFNSYVASYYTRLTADDTQQLDLTYPSFGDSQGNVYNYSTTGTGSPTALEISGWGNGEQQRVFNLQAESMFACPAYWLAEAFPTGWKYEFSVAPAEHAYDTGSYFFSNDSHPGFTNEFVSAFINLWGNFVVNGDPRITTTQACGPNCAHSSSSNVDSWQPYSVESPTHLVANVSGGTVGQYGLFGYPWTIPYQTGDGIVNDFYVADAASWEGGRAARCEFWRGIGARVPG